jgi:hypothetical protein
MPIWPSPGATFSPAIPSTFSESPTRRIIRDRLVSRTRCSV